MLDITYLTAFLAGLVSFVSPCVLPIVPPYLAYLAGISFSQLSSEELSSSTTRRILSCAILFVAGFTTVFVALGASASLVGQSVSQYFDILSTLAGIVIIIMGLHFLGVFKIAFLYREARFNLESNSGSLLGAYIMGLAFAFGWTPCVGPVLATILFIAGAEDTVVRGASLLAVYSLGIGIPFILAAAFARVFLNWASRFRRHIATVEKFMGGLLVVTGIMFLTGFMPVVAQWMLEQFPQFATFG